MTSLNPNNLNHTLAKNNRPPMIILAGLLFAPAAILAARLGVTPWLTAAAALIILFLAYRSWSIFNEAAFYLTLACWLTNDKTTACFPIIALTLSLLTCRITDKSTRLSLLIYALINLVTLFLLAPPHTRPIDVILLASALTLLLITALNTLAPRSPCTHIDLILNSHTGNTAHLANQFIAGAQSAHASVTLHRFHRYRDFAPTLTGDALALAFPVIGWKPAWPLLLYLIAKLPRSRGKTAFILTSSAGGPENAPALTWLILTLKGYRPTGQLSIMYPINVPTFRIGSANFWRRIDQKTPKSSDLTLAKLAGQQFALAQPAGVTPIPYPFPLFAVGFLLDNPWLNRFAYRTYTWKRRCTRCGFCINYCPAARLFWKKGFPHARGTCTLCMGCVNLCPARAMHIAAYTEYGNPYPPRWPEGIFNPPSNPNNPDNQNQILP